MTWTKVKVRRRIPKACLKRADAIYHRMMLRNLIVLTFIGVLCCSSFPCGIALGEDSWTFVVMGDSRGVYETTTTGVSLYLPAIASKIASLSLSLPLRPSAVLFAGDLINGNDVPKKKDGDPSIPYEDQFKNWKSDMAPVYAIPGIAIYPVRGNHENVASDDVAPIAALKQAYYDAFGAIVPQNGPNNGVGDDQVGFSWDLKLKNVRIVTADQYFYFHEIPVGGRNYFEIDQAWVDKQLSKTAPRPYTFVMAHEPAYSLSKSEGGFYGTSAEGIANRETLWNSMGANGSKMYLTGHVHNVQVGTAVDDSGNVIYQDMMGNGGAPIDSNEGGKDPLLTPTYSDYTHYGFSLFTVTDNNITETYYLYDPVLNTWSFPDPDYTITLIANKVCTWNAPLGTGTFSNVSSWDPGKVPDTAYTAVFDSGASTSSTVNFTAGANNKRLFVASGSVTFNLAGYTYTTDSAAIDGSEDTSYCPSLTISGAGSHFNPTVVTMDGVTSSLTVVGSGASATCNRITIEGGTATLGGNITANEYINLADSGPDQTLKIGSDSNITGNILSGTSGADTGGTRGTLEFKGNATVTGNIGEGGTESFKLITVGKGSVMTDGDIRATTINFAGDNDLHIGDGHTIATGAGSGVTATTSGNGTLIFDGSSTVNSNIGAGVWGTRIKEVDVAAPGSVVTFNGTINSSTITINSATASAVIGSSGTSAATNFNLAAGTLDLGANTLTLGAAGAGKYTQAAGTTLKTTIQSTAVAGNINASSAANGKCSVPGASNLIVTVDPVYIPSNTTWTILDGKAGTGGVAVLPTITTNSQAVTFAAAAANGGDDLTITATRIANAYANEGAGNSNAAAVGAVLDNIANPSGDMANVMGQLGVMSSANAESALSTMTPDISSGTMQASQQAVSQFLGSVSNRLGYARDGMIGLAIGDMIQGMGFWMQGLGSNLNQGERNGIQGFSANTFGTSIGADKLINDHIRLGLAGGYGFADINSKTPGSPSDSVNSYQGTVYASYDSINLNKEPANQKGSKGGFRNRGENSLYSDWMFGFTQNNFDSRREIWLTPLSARVAKAEHYGQQYATKLEAGYTIVTQMTKKLETTPFASLQYSYLRMNQYKENGADSLDLSVDGSGYNQLLQVLGTKFAYPFATKKAGTFIPAVKAAWLYDYIGDRFETTASFAGGGASFNTRGAKPAKSGILFGGELAFLNKGNVTLTGNWDLEVKDQFMSNTYYGTVRYDF